MKIYLIRHGQTDWNLDGKIQGKTDIALNRTGLKQAELLARAMDDRPVSHVFCSSLKRAEETAAQLSGRQKARLMVVEGLKEVDFGLWEGMTWKEIENTYPEDFAEWDKNPVTYAPTGGERRRDVRLRCREAMEYILEHAKGDIAIVSHGAMLAFVFNYLFAGQKARQQIIVKNASVTTILYEPEKKHAVLLDLNDDRHLG